jgi:hypothetical protein
MAVVESENRAGMAVGNAASHVVTTVIFAPFTYRIPRRKRLQRGTVSLAQIIHYRSLVLCSTVVRMGEVEIDQRLRDLQREYLDFLDDEVLKLLYCSLYVKTYRDTSIQ